MTFCFIKFGYNIFYISKNITYFHPKLITSCMKYHNITHGIGNFKTEISALNSCILKPFKLSYITHCYYAKGKDKKRSDKGGQKKKIVLHDEDVSEIIQISTMRSSMEQAVSNLKQDFLKHLSLRSTTGSIESLEVTFEGKTYYIEELAQVVRKNPKTIVINMSSFPQAIPLVSNALLKSGMNLNPQQDGTTLFVPVPKITKDHRENLSKNAKALFLKCKDTIKDIKNKYTKTVKSKEKDGLSKDLSQEITELILQIHDEYISNAEKILLLKQQELTGEAN